MGEVLGLEPKMGLDAATLRVRFRKMSLLVHPDKNPHPQASACFQRLGEAMRVIGDETERDKLLHTMWAEQLQSELDDGSSQPNPVGVKMDSEPPADHLEESSDDENDADVRARFAQRAQRERMARHGGLQGFSKRQKTAHDDASAEVASGSQANENVHGNLGQAVEADPNALWQKGGLHALASAGWQRIESRSQPGLFYFGHVASGRSVAMALAQEASAEQTSKACSDTHTPVPVGWELRASRSQLGVFYYV